MGIVFRKGLENHC